MNALLFNIPSKFSLCFLALSVLAIPAGLQGQDSETKKTEEEKPKTYQVQGQIIIKGILDTDKPRFDISRFSLMEEIKLPKLNYPKGYDTWTEAEKRKWVVQFRATPEGKEYSKKRLQAIRSRKIFKFLPNKEGEFTIENVVPGKYRLVATIRALNSNPAIRNKTQVISSHNQVVEVKEGDVQLGPVVVNRIPSLGVQAPDFEFKTTDGKKKRLKDYRGKYILLDFWATWCTPCLGETPNLMKTHKDFAGKHFEILGLSLDRTIEAPKKYIEQHSLKWVHGYLGDWSQNKVTDKYGINGIPSIWLLSPEGKVIKTGLRGPNIYLEVEKVVTAKIEHEKKSKEVKKPEKKSAE